MRRSPFTLGRARGGILGVFAVFSVFAVTAPMASNPLSWPLRPAGTENAMDTTEEVDSGRPSVSVPAQASGSQGRNTQPATTAEQPD